LIGSFLSVIMLSGVSSLRALVTYHRHQRPRPLRQCQRCGTSPESTGAERRRDRPKPERPVGKCEHEPYTAMFHLSRTHTLGAIVEPKGKENTVVGRDLLRRRPVARVEVV
jgi:hypothetical protein